MASISPHRPFVRSVQPLARLVTALRQTAPLATSTARSTNTCLITNAWTIVPLVSQMLSLNARNAILNAVHVKIKHLHAHLATVLPSLSSTSALTALTSAPKVPPLITIN
jgi:hypothetical protein